MIALGLRVLRRSGRPRAVLVAASTAGATALLLVAVTMVLLPEEPNESLFDLVAQPGLRYGTAFGTVLLVLPLVLLLYQAVRVGTATRERRLAALRLAGATTQDIRLTGAVEVGVPAAAGAFAGVAVFALLRATLGGVPDDQLMSTGLKLVPTTVSPAWWQFVLIVSAVTMFGILTGLRASRHVVTTPLGVTRRQRPRPPRPWGFALVALAVAVAAVGAGVSRYITYEGLATAVAMIATLLVIIGLVSLASWITFRIGRWIQARSANPATVLAAGQLVAEPRRAGRASAAIGAVALVASGGGATMADAAASSGGPGMDRFYVVSFGLVAAALVLALAVATATMGIHAVESVLDRRRELASAVAAGVPRKVIETAQRRTGTLVALPLALIGAALGTVALTLLSYVSGYGAGHVLADGVVASAVTVGLVWLAIGLVTALIRPWLREATSPVNLRTE